MGIMVGSLSSLLGVSGLKPVRLINGCSYYIFLFYFLNFILFFLNRYLSIILFD